MTRIRATQDRQKTTPEAGPVTPPMPALPATDIEAGQGKGKGGLRDRALVLLGFAGAFRRSELVALDVGHIEQTEAGLRVTIAQSKTDQEGKGETIAILRGDVACPVKALTDWLTAAAITQGPVFRPVGKGG